MKQIVLISCVPRKGTNKVKAKDLYKGPLFTNSLAYGQALRPDKVFILSALHYLLDPDKEIEPYDVTLSNVPKDKRKTGLRILNSQEKKDWGKKVLEQLSVEADLKNDEFIILAGQSYIKPINSGLANIKEPLKGIVQRKRPDKLKELISELDGKSTP